MAFLRRRPPLHQRLAEEGGLTVDARPAAPAAQPPGWDGEPQGEPGIHGVPRARRWDAVATVAAPALRGDRVRFVALPDGTLILEDDGGAEDEQPDGALTAVADAVEASLAPPYRADAVRRDGPTWAVAASRIRLVEARGLEGEEVELVSTRNGLDLQVDGRPRLGSVPAFEADGRAHGPEYVVRARRLDGELWELETAAL